MSKSVKTIVGVAAAVAIPFAAPAIASSIGLSGAIAGAIGSATAGNVIGGALTGAALGATKGAVLGEDRQRGALLGGLGGALGGYTSATAAAPSATPSVGTTAAGLTMPSTEYEGIGNAGLAQTTTEAAIDAGTLGGTQTAGGSFLDVLRKVPGEVAAKFSDPKAMADLTLRAAGQLAGSALAGSGLSEQEQALLDAQTAELQRLQTENAGLFAQRLQQAQNLIGESRYFDPEYFGLQSARRAQLAGTQAKRAGLRGLTGESRAAQARRYDIETGRSTGTAYDVGYGTGLQGRLQTMQAGMTMMPTGYPSSSADYGQLRQAYGGAEQRRAQQAKDIGSLFGSITGRS
jgi:hypothetical protein